MINAGIVCRKGHPCFFFIPLVLLFTVKLTFYLVNIAHSFISFIKLILNYVFLVWHCKDGSLATPSSRYDSCANNEGNKVPAAKACTYSARCKASTVGEHGAEQLERCWDADHNSVQGTGSRSVSFWNNQKLSKLSPDICIYNSKSVHLSIMLCISKTNNDGRYK